MTLNGTVIATILAGVAHDAAGNPNAASTSTDNQVTFTISVGGGGVAPLAPTVTLTSTAPDPTNTSPIPVTATFSGNVFGFAVGDITVGNGTAGNFAGGPSIFTFDVTPSGQGAVTVDIDAGVAQDAAGNGNTAATQLSRTYDSIAPTVTTDQAIGQADPTNASPINFTVVFSEAVSDFGDVDVTVSSGTAAVTGSGTAYNVAVTGISEGVVTASIAASVAHDAAGNGNAASTSTDNQVTYDTTAPVVPTLISPANGALVYVSVVALDWSDVPGANQYQVQVDNNADFSNPEYDSGWINTSQATTPALANGTYYWRARAKDNAGNQGAWSTVWSFTISVGGWGVWPIVGGIIAAVVVVGSLIFFLYRRRRRSK
jgi:hypothetical protein